MLKERIVRTWDILNSETLETTGSLICLLFKEHGNYSLHFTLKRKVLSSNNQKIIVKQSKDNSNIILTHPLKP